jgi:general secretion pathway protein C
MMSRLPVEKLSIFAFLLMLGYFLSDFTLLSIRGGMYPQPSPPGLPAFRMVQNQGGGNLSAIRDRNIFNADGKIPPGLGEQTGQKQPEIDPEPVPTNLPLTLLGTIVHANPARSIASIAVKTKNDQVAVKAGDTIPEGLATVIQVERNKVTFRNLASKRREYLELKDDSKINFGTTSKPVQMGEVTAISETSHEIKRSDIDRLTSNLPELLQQARAVPRLGPGGTIECFNLAEIAPGSIYERLGLKRNDCIKSVNGERVDSPAKAMELYNALKSGTDSINVGIERGGRDDNFQYSITK